MAGMLSKKPQLPKSVLDMKFMKKTKERIERELQNTQDHDTLYSYIITDEMRTATDNFITESSFTFCEKLIEGRVSFKGMNPEIERIMELDKQNEKPDREMKKDISDEILAKKFESFNKRRRTTDSPSKYAGFKKKKYYKN